MTSTRHDMPAWLESLPPLHYCHRAQSTLSALQAQYCVKGQTSAPEWRDLTGLQWLQEGEFPKQQLLICQLLHQSVRLWWPKDKKYYKGTVTSYKPDKVKPPSLPCEHPCRMLGCVKP